MIAAIEMKVSIPSCPTEAPDWNKFAQILKTFFQCQVRKLEEIKGGYLLRYTLDELLPEEDFYARQNDLSKIVLSDGSSGRFV
jgi:hypothetical protein